MYIYIYIYKYINVCMYIYIYAYMYHICVCVCIYIERGSVTRYIYRERDKYAIISILLSIFTWADALPPEGEPKQPY